MEIPDIKIKGEFSLTDLIRLIVKEEMSKESTKSSSEIDSKIEALEKLFLGRIETIEEETKHPISIVPIAKTPIGKRHQSHNKIAPISRYGYPLRCPDNKTLWSSATFQTLAYLIETGRQNEDSRLIKTLRKIGWTSPTALRAASIIRRENKTAPQIAKAIGCTTQNLYAIRVKMAKTNFPKINEKMLKE